MKYIESTVKLFKMYQQLGEKAMSQMTDEQLFWAPDTESNSVAVIVKHLWGNMLSRWTDFLTTDGEKATRNRDAEFETDVLKREELLSLWADGWNCLYTALNSVTDNDLDRIVYIRNEGHTVTDAINRQIAHYASHVGQIVYIAKMCAGSSWVSLSIPRGKSDAFNAEKFSKDKEQKHFTDGMK